MNICIDARSPGTGGVLTYTYNLLHSLFKIDSTNKYYVITEPNHKYEYDNVEHIFIPNMPPHKWFLWSNTTLVKLLDEKEVDIYHTLKHVTLFRSKVKKLLTFHGAEMIYKHAGLYKKHDLIYWRTVYTLAGKYYDRIISATRHENQYFCNKKKLDSSKFRTTNLAANPKYRKIENSGYLDNERQRLKLPKNFILVVGRYHPIKNFERIILAYNKALNKIDHKYKLVILAEKAGAYFDKIESLVRSLNIDDQVILYGRAGDELVNIYNLADLFLFPSLYENFGIVLLEAMACGLPVISSNIDSIDEVVENACLRVNPTSIDSIATAIIKVICNSELSIQLSNMSLERARLFSWSRCANETLEIYTELINS